MVVWLVAAVAAAEVAGTVRVHGSGTPVAGAAVRVGALETTTDERGRFTVAPPPGAAVVEVSAEGFRPSTTAVDVMGDRPTVLVIRLVSATEEIVVVEEGSGSFAEHVVTVEELGRVPGAFGDPIRALQSLPSVSRTGDLSGELVVRGAEATNTAVYVDGIRVPYLYHLLLGRSVVDPAVIDDVVFHPGAVPARYGNVTQAVVDARIADGPAARGVHGTAHLDPLDGGASLTANLSPRTTLRTSVRVGWAAAVASGALGAWNGLTGSTGPLPELTFPYLDGTLRLEHRTGADTWSLSALGARDVLRYVPASTPEPIEDQVIRRSGYDPYLLVDAGFSRGRLRWDRVDGAREASAWLIGGRDHQQNLVPLLGRLGAGGVQDARATQWNATAGFSSRSPLGDRAAIEIGGEGVVQPSVYRELDEDRAPPPLAFTTAYLGPYASVPVRLGRLERSAVTPAVRVSLHQFGEPWAAVPEPQVSSRLALSESAAVLGFVGFSSQGPKLAEIGAGDPRAAGVTRAAQTSVGLELRSRKGISLEVTGYATEMWGIVVRDTEWVIRDRPTNPAFVGMSTTTTGGGTEPVEWHGLLHERPLFRSATGEAVGAEVLLRLAPRGPQFGWISASAGRSFRTTAGPEGGTAPADADLPLALVGVYGLGLPRGWNLSARAQGTSGLPFTPLEPVYAYVFNDPSYAEIAYFDTAAVPGRPNADRYPIYARLDLRIEKTWVGPRALWTVYLDVFNSTNRHNPLWSSYNWNYSELERDVYVPIVPALGLAVEY